MQTLTRTDLARLAPAAFAEAPHSKMSDKYSFVRTIDVNDALTGAGWVPTFAAQSRVRDQGRSGLQRHVIRYRHPDMRLAGRADGVHPELVLVNAHDGSSAYQLHAGLFRMVCGNGLIIADETFEKLSIKHIGTSQGDVVEGSFRVVSEIPKVADAIDGMRSVMLSLPEQTALAEAACSLRWDEGKAPVEPVQLLTARRYEDKAQDLWSTFNRVQENIIRGGIRGRSPSTGRRARTRGVGSVAEDTKINKALWRLAEEMRRIKVAA